MKKNPSPKSDFINVKPAGKRSAKAKSPASSSQPMEGIREAVTRLKRERIISTAVELFHINGLGNTTLEAVADKMNVTKPFIYSHFRSKSELLAEICAHGIRASLDVLNRVLASDASATEKVKTLVHDFMLTVLANQGYFAIYTREQKHLSKVDSDTIDNMRREFDRKFSALLTEGVGKGEFIVDDIQMASLAIGGIVSWTCVWYRPNGRLNPEETAESITKLVLTMIQGKPGRDPSGANQASVKPATKATSKAKTRP